MERARLAEVLLASARRPPAAVGDDAWAPPRKVEAEGGCGVIGAACSVRIPGRALLGALTQMRNRGNGKGGGVAAAGLDPAFFAVDPGLLRDDYLLAVAYLDAGAPAELERAFVDPTFVVDHVFEIPSSGSGLAVRPPDVRCYFVRVRPQARDAFMRESGIEPVDAEAAEDEIVYRNSERLNRAFYSSTGEKRAFVLSHGRDLLVLKLVGYGDDVVRHYGLEELRAHVWIGHHRYPTKGRVWHPGGAHPFVGLHEALVHNGDFANYASICAYLAQCGRHPLFLTDTEVAALLFDLHHRVYGYSLEHVIEAMAPTTERDFALLSADRRRVYRMLQTVHVHGSPDGPWFFLIAQSQARGGAYRLIGITDTSMLRPQVFALQHGSVRIGLAASEKQAIDAALERLAEEDPCFWGRADSYWNARGGSHTDGGAFIFTVRPELGPGGLDCTDKFGRAIEPDPSKLALDGRVRPARGADAGWLARRDLTTDELFDELTSRLAGWDYSDVQDFLDGLERGHPGRALDILTRLLDSGYPTGRLKRSCLLWLADVAMARVVERLRRTPASGLLWVGHGALPEQVEDGRVIVVVDARGFAQEGADSLARALVRLREAGARRLVVAGARGHRFLGCGLGPRSDDVRIDVFGTPGDYLASGIDGVQLVVHGTAQDQVAQIMKDGLLVVHGDVGQTFGYAAKGGRAFLRGSAAGRPLINAVGRPRIVINGTCLDYLAESFMAGDPLQDGGFVVVNGVAFDEDGSLRDLDPPYPGGNLFSLASGGALYVRDPRGRLGEDQLNGGEFAALGRRDWAVLRPLLEENERVFGIPLQRLLSLDGRQLPPELVYRKVRPREHRALSAEEDWVKQRA